MVGLALVRSFGTDSSWVITAITVGKLRCIHYYHQNRNISCQYYKKEVNKKQKAIVNLCLYELQSLMQQGVELEQYLNTCQNIPTTFIKELFFVNTIISLGTTPY